LSDELHAYLEGRPNTAAGNNTLEQLGTILDSAAGLHPQIFLMQSVCEMARIGADVLDGKALKASDMLSVLTMQRTVMGLRRTATRKNGNIRRKTPRSSAQPLKHRLQSVVKTSPWYWLSDWVRRQFSSFRAAEVDVTPPKSPTHAETLDLGETGHATSPALADEVGQSKTIADEVDSVGFVKSSDETASAHFRTLTHLAPASMYERPERVHMAHQGMPPPARAAVAHVENVPFVRRADANGESEWQFAALSDYRPKPPMTAPSRAEDGGVYLINGREFVHLEGHLYPIQFVSRDQPWLVDRQSEGDRWQPPLPLQRVGPDRWAPTMPALRHDAGAHGARAGTDGFIRIGGRRFIALSGITVEVSPPFIHNEVAIRHLAEHREEALPDIDAEQIIRTPDGGQLLQGRYGFYPVAFDAAQQRMRVQASSDAARFSLLFDLRTEEWHVRDADLNAHGSARPRAQSLGLPSKPAAQRHASLSESVSPGLDVSASISASASASASGGGVASDAMRTRKESLLMASSRLRGKTLLASRPALRLFLAETFDAMADMRLHRGNRRDSAPDIHAKTPYPPIWIGEVRNTIYALLPDANHWEWMTVLEKQEQTALAADLAYRTLGESSLAQQSAYCNEMADLLVAQICTRSPSLRGHMLQIGVRDLPGTGLTHVTVVYAEDPSYFRTFGPLTEAGVTPMDLPVLGKAAFGDYLWHYREVLVLLDPWGDTKVLEPIAFDTKDALVDAFDANLRLAGFTVGPNREFRVQAVIPARH
jgi:hypothetical protein